MLPHARVGGISGLLEIVNDRGGREDLPKLAESLRLEVDDLLPAVDASACWVLPEVAQGDVTITEAGKEFATAGVHRSHEIFKEQLLKHVPFATTVIEAIRAEKGRPHREGFPARYSGRTLLGIGGGRQFQTLVDWGRYAHLFEYDADEERLYIADATSEPAGN